MKLNFKVLGGVAAFAVFMMVAWQNCQPSYIMKKATGADDGSQAITAIPDPGPSCTKGVDCPGDPQPPIANFKCTRIIPITLADPLDVPARANDGVCYSLKILDAVANGPSNNTTVEDLSIVSRNHDYGSGDSYSTRHPYLLGKSLVRLFMHDRRYIKLSSSGTDELPILVDNFLVVGTFRDNASHVADPSFYQAYGTMDSTINGTNTIELVGQPVVVNDFGAGGTSSITPLDITSYVQPNAIYDLDVRLLDCGSVRESSDVYLLFQ